MMLRLDGGAGLDPVAPSIEPTPIGPLLPIDTSRPILWRTAAIPVHRFASCEISAAAGAVVARELGMRVEPWLDPELPARIEIEIVKNAGLVHVYVAGVRVDNDPLYDIRVRRVYF